MENQPFNPYKNFKRLDPRANTSGSFSISLNDNQIYINKKLSEALNLYDNCLWYAEVYLDDETQEILVDLMTEPASDDTLNITVSKDNKNGSGISSKGIMRSINQLDSVDLDKYIYYYTPENLDLKNARFIIKLKEPYNKKEHRNKVNEPSNTAEEETTGEQFTPYQGPELD